VKEVKMKAKIVEVRQTDHRELYSPTYHDNKRFTDRKLLIEEKFETENFDTDEPIDLLPALQSFKSKNIKEEAASINSKSKDLASAKVSTKTESQSKQKEEPVSMDSDMFSDYSEVLHLPRKGVK